MSNMSKGCIQLIGVDLQNSASVPVDIVAGCSTIVISARMQTQLTHVLGDFEQEKIISIAPLTEAIDKIQRHLKDGDVAVIASGDPMFFGIGKRLVEDFGRDAVVVHPALSSIQHAFAQFRINWDDTAVLSLHGRSERNFVGKLLSRHKTVLLTDAKMRPEVIAASLIDFLEDTRYFTAYVAENIGMVGERFISGTLQEIASAEFGNLCCMILVRKSNQQPGLPSFGLTEDDITHSRGLITKREVRAAVLHSLAIPENGILWDVGAGSGSIGLEAARLFPELLVYSVEKSEEQHENILRNKSRYDTCNLKLIKGAAPEKLHGLPRPDRVFIGGNGGNLEQIIQLSNEQLQQGGRLVVTAVIDKTYKEAPEYMFKCGLDVEMSRIEVTRLSYPDRQEQSFNPITIIVGHKR